MWKENILVINNLGKTVSPSVNSVLNNFYVVVAWTEVIKI